MLEAGLFDACFFEDLAGVYDTFQGKFDAILGRGGQLNLLDPLMVLPYVARATSRLGLGITLSTTFYHPFHIARMLGSLDHLSAGRIAWNVVTSANDFAARNFGHAKLAPHANRYARAREFVQVVQKLGDTWDASGLVATRPRLCRPVCRGHLHVPAPEVRHAGIPRRHARADAGCRP